MEKLEQERIERRRIASQKLKELVISSEEITHATIYREFQKMFQENEIYNAKEVIFLFVNVERMRRKQGIFKDKTRRLSM